MTRRLLITATVIALLGNVVVWVWAHSAVKRLDAQVLELREAAEQSEEETDSRALHDSRPHAVQVEFIDPDLGTVVFSDELCERTADSFDKLKDDLTANGVFKLSVGDKLSWIPAERRYSRDLSFTGLINRLPHRGNALPDSMLPHI